MTRPDKNHILASHRLSWDSLWLWLTFLAVFTAAQAFLAYLVAREVWWPVPIVVFVLAHLMHTHLLALHDAAHGTLCPNYYVNEAAGIFIGTLGLIEFSLFRVVHHAHHAYMGTARDEELWPFVNPEVPRGRRRLCAFLELSAGLFYTPFLLLRSFFRKGTPITNPRIRRRIYAELVVMLTVWSGILAITAYANVWKYLLILYVCPAWLAGSMQSLRKYVEHMGLLGGRVLECTRTIIPRTVLGRFVVWTMFHEPYHGVHHKLPRLPHFALPEHSAMLEPPVGEEIAPFPNYRTALWEMLATLDDPRVGAQWREQFEVKSLAKGNGSAGVKALVPRQITPKRQRLEPWYSRLLARVAVGMGYVASRYAADSGSGLPK